MAERIPTQETDSSNTPESNQAELLAASKAHETHLLEVRDLLVRGGELSAAQRSLLVDCVDVALSFDQDGTDAPPLDNPMKARQGKT